ncbi:MAG: PDZ domain-containing protein [Planctomycetota bacterium]
MHVFTTGLSRERLGTRVTSMSPELREFFGAPKDAGILVQEIEDDSPAAKAGVRVGDVLVGIGGEPIAEASDVRRALAARKGAEVEVEVVRKKKRKTLKATLPERGPQLGVFTVPEFPEIVVPAEALEQLPVETRREVERELEEARRQLREVQRELERLERGRMRGTVETGKRERKRDRKQDRKRRVKRRGSSME